MMKPYRRTKIQQHEMPPTFFYLRGKKEKISRLANSALLGNESLSLTTRGGGDISLYVPEYCTLLENQYVGHEPTTITVSMAKVTFII